MRYVVIGAALLAVSACAHTGNSSEGASRSNAAQATADAARIASGAETDPDSRSAACYVMIGLSRERRSTMSWLCACCMATES